MASLNMTLEKDTPSNWQFSINPEKTILLRLDFWKFVNSRIAWFKLQPSRFESWNSQWDKLLFIKSHFSILHFLKCVPWKSTVVKFVSKIFAFVQLPDIKIESLNLQFSMFTELTSKLNGTELLKEHFSKLELVIFWRIELLKVNSTSTQLPLDKSHFFSSIFNSAMFGSGPPSNSCLWFIVDSSDIKYPISKPNIFANFWSWIKSGKDSPRSHFPTACGLIAICTDNWSCVKFLDLRAFKICWPIVFAVLIYIFYYKSRFPMASNVTISNNLRLFSDYF